MGKEQRMRKEAVFTEVKLGPLVKPDCRYDVSFNPPGLYPKQFSGFDGNKGYTIKRGGTVTLSAAKALQLQKDIPEAITIKEHYGAA